LNNKANPFLRKKLAEQIDDSTYHIYDTSSITMPGTRPKKAKESAQTEK
jgi:hypothetical protein